MLCCITIVYDFRPHFGEINFDYLMTKMQSTRVLLYCIAPKQGYASLFVGVYTMYL